MKKAVIYLRTSSDKQIDNTSIPTQEAKCREYCEREGLEIFDIQKREATSANGEKDNRVKELIRYCLKNKGKFEVLVVHKLDRFARDIYQHTFLRHELQRMGIVLRSTSERVDETAQGKFLETVLAGVNQLDNDVKKERVKLSLRRRIEEGLWPFAPPVGYRRPKVEGVRLSVCEWDPQCSREIIRLFELYSSGAYSFASLATLMNKKHLINSRRRIMKCGKQHILKILTNQFYIGIIKVKDYPICVGKHKSLISPSLWQKCQDVLNKKSNNATHYRMHENPAFPLRRFTLCGFCQHPLTACFSKGKMGTQYPHYYCYNKNCVKNGKMVRQYDFHKEFSEYLTVTKPKEELLPLFKEVFIARYSERVKDFKGDDLRKEQECERLNKEKREVAIKGVQGIFPDLTVKEMLSDYEQKIIIAQNDMKETSHKELNLKPLLNKGFELIRTLEVGWQEALPERKPKLQKIIFPEGLSYQYKGFSNSRLCLCFALINDFEKLPSTNVSLTGFEPVFTE